MKTARFGTALLLFLALAFAPAAHAQVVLDPDDPVEDEPIIDLPGEQPDPADPRVGEGPPDPEAAEEIAPDTPGVEEPEPPVRPLDEEPQRWGNLPPLPVIGAPVQAGTYYQPAVTPVAHQTQWVSDFVHYIMLAIVIFVTVLVLYAAWRFSAKRNPTPARFSHNTRIEVTWTLVPVLILIVIGSFSLPILFKQLEVPEPDLTVKATGHQWYWTYEYPDYEFGFDSFMLARDELEQHGFDPAYYLMATDTALVVPVGAVVHVQVTASDVIHAWKVNSFGVMIDAIPGRLNETWFQAEREGVYFGFCSELCGLDHTFMPITVKVVSPEDYEAWLDWAIAEFGGTRPEAEVAAAD